MRIESLKAVYPNYENVASSWRTHLWQIVVEVRTDVGVVGYGYGGGGLASLPIVNGHFKELLVGKSLNSPEDVMWIWDHLYYESIPYGRKGIAMMALSGVDLALWDALGKAERHPVAELLGGVKQRPDRCLRDWTRLRVVRGTRSCRTETDPPLGRNDRRCRRNRHESQTGDGRRRKDHVRCLHVLGCRCNRENGKRSF